jgi:multisubunit Na+/H+ antiporter MnhC subunit
MLSKSEILILTAMLIGVALFTVASVVAAQYYGLTGVML